VEKYSLSVAWSESDGEYVATSPEFPGLSGLGSTAEEAVRELQAAMEAAVEAFVEDGEPIPEPLYAQSFSGQFRLRIPKSLHSALTVRAQAEGVSLNTLVQGYVAAGLASDQLASRAVQRLDGACARAEQALSAMASASSRKSVTTFNPDALLASYTEGGILATSAPGALELSYN
jgi:predicted HicB family RNase H-like nuclease